MKKTVFPLKLGMSTSVLNGYNPAWIAGTSNGLFPAEKKPLQEKEITPPDELKPWSFPVITLHNTAEELLHELFPVAIENPGRDTEEAIFSSGELLIGDADRVQALEQVKQVTGVDMSVPGRGYALVRLIRKDFSYMHMSSLNGILVHAHPINPDPELGVDETFRQALSRLRPCLDLSSNFHPEHFTRTIVSEYIDLFKTYGTHYVSGIDSGDCIYQVFSYDATKFASLKKAFNDENSFEQEDSANFSYFTSSAATGPFGYAAETGHIVSFSKDKALTESLKAGDWFEPTWAKANSIFAMFNQQSKVTRRHLDELFTEKTVVSCRLSSLTLFSETQRRHAWSRVFSGAMVQKYPGTAPHMNQYFKASQLSLFTKGGMPGFASALATPVINVYKPRVDLNQLQFGAPEVMKDFTLSTNLLTIAAQTGTDDTRQAENISLPAGKVLIAAQAIAMESTEHVSVLNLPGIKEDKQVVFCNMFFGMLRVKTGAADYTILDGIQFSSATKNEFGRYAVAVAADVRTAPPATAAESLKSSLQYIYTFLQSGWHHNSALSNPLCAGFLSNGMEWLAKQIPADSSDIELLSIRMMAMDLARNCQENTRGAHVPVLQADAYDRQIQAVFALLDNVQGNFRDIKQDLNNRRTAELIVTVGETLNSNIIASGKSLVGYIESSAALQGTMAGYYSSLADHQQTMYKQAVENITNLQNLVDAQQEAVNSAVENYKKKVQEWVTMKAITAAFEIIGGIFSAVGGGGAKPAAEAGKAVTELAKTIEKIKKIITVTAALAKAYQQAKTAAREIKAANEAMEVAGGAQQLIMTPLEWDEMLVNLGTVMSGGPSDGSAGEAKDELLGAYKILVLRGRALVDAQGDARRLAWEMFNNQKLKAISEGQAERLQKMNTTFNVIDSSKLDIAKVDLAGLTGYLGQIQNQMFTMLSATFTLRDQALQYKYLQPSTLIDNFDLTGFRAALVAQEAATSEADKKLRRVIPTDTAPITYAISNVPAEDLINGNTFRFSIGLDAKEFMEYVTTRVMSLTVSVGGKVKTPGGKFIISLRCIADPFFDRDMSRNPITYNTLSREKEYVYESDTMKPLFDANDGFSWSAGVNPVTPFSTWEISFPKTERNKGIQFSSPFVSIFLDFKLNARVKDAPALFRKPAIAGKMLKGAGALLAEPVKPAETEIVSQIYARGSVTNNWDVVYNMTLSKINATLKKQFDDFKSKPDFLNRIKTEIRTEVMKDVYAIKKFDITYGYPLLNFLANNPNNVELTCMVNGSITKCMEMKGVQSCDEPVAVKEETLKAIIPIAMITGIVQPKDAGSKVYSVVLDMSKGTFTAENMGLSDEEKVEFNKQFKAHFINNKVVYVINSLDLSKIATLDDLKPNEFRFKTLITPNGNQMLQLFIQTAGRPALNESQTFLNDLPEPIPMGRDSSLILSNKIFFSGVLPSSINAGWGIEGKAPETGRPAWISRFKSGTISGTVDTKGLTQHSSSGGRGGTSSSTTWVFLNKNESNTLNWSVEGMTISPTDKGTLRLSFQQTRNVGFVTKTITTMCSIIGCKDSGPYYHDYSTDVKVTMGAGFPVDLGGSGREQSIGLRISDQQISIDGEMSGGGPCGCDNMQNTLNRAIRDQVPGQVTSMLNVSFNPISVFALQNLLFPSDAVIKFKSVYTPGDIVIFGEF
ncbi:MAC/perforin domain-containing protein [Chitinophagaceae bacterium MMS25-I14]